MKGPWLLVFLAALPLSCGGLSQGKKASEAHTLGTHLDPALFENVERRRDSSGEFVQIDDMRFRVSRDPSLVRSGGMWPNGTLSYELSPAVRQNAFWTSQLKAACAALVANSGVGCIDRALSGPLQITSYVYVVSSTSNHSYVGRVGGAQELGIVDWGNRIIIAHELKHALGWSHEHQRRDRDRYVIVHGQAIEAGAEHNFALDMGSFVDTPYDFESIMHYPPYAFSAAGQKTIEPLPAYAAMEPLMGQRTRITAIDNEEIRKVYGEAGTEWCGLTRKPHAAPPQGCFLECYLAADPTYGRWYMCGSCAGATICP